VYPRQVPIPPGSPVVSVIIPARDAAPTLERTLSALGAQTLAESFEVIVVDDGSGDETAEIAARHAPLVTLLRNGHGGGPGKARNQAVEAARSRVLAFTDADCFPVPEWLAEGLRALEGADIVQGRVARDPSVLRTPFDRSLEVEDDGGFYQTANLFVRRELFEAVGGFRDWALESAQRRRWSVDHRRGRATRTPIGEDTLFAWTARRRGARSAFAPAALVHHAVFPGKVRDAMADRWHWTRDMPGLVQLVPELRDGVLYRRWFFADWSAQFDLAVGGLLLAALARNRLPLLASTPYARRIWREGASFEGGGAPRPVRWRRRAGFILGAPLVDATTLAGFVAGSREWRTLVL